MRRLRERNGAHEQASAILLCMVRHKYLLVLISPAQGELTHEDDNPLPLLPQLGEPKSNSSRKEGRKRASAN